TRCGPGETRPQPAMPCAGGVIKRRNLPGAASRRVRSERVVADTIERGRRAGASRHRPGWRSAAVLLPRPEAGPRPVAAVVRTASPGLAATESEPQGPG